jgi:hypothetical protein
MEDYKLRDLHASLTLVGLYATVFFFHS